MKDTVRTITIGIDCNQIKREIYAESACIALMSPQSGRPEILTGDHDKLISAYIGNAITGFAAKFCAFIDGEKLNLEQENDILQIPFIVPESSKLPAEVIRRLAERIIATSVLAICYETRHETAGILLDRCSEYKSRLLIALK